MAKYSNTVEYQIRTTLDSSGIAKLKAELTSLQNLTKTKGAQGLLSQSQVNKTLADINKVKTALNQAFNPKLGMVSNKALFGSIGKDLNSIYGSFSKLGPQGVRAFAQVYGQVGKIDMGMKRISSTSDKIMNTFGNTFRWGAIASVFSGIMNSIHQSAQYVKDLDKSLTNIQMVTAQSRESMNDFAVQANEAAKRLGGTTVQMTNATEVFIRQGHDLQTSTQLGEYAVHLANVSGQDSAAASDEITAYMNAFKIPLGDLGNAVSKWAAVANNAAVSVEELSVASQKAASVATTVGVDMDQFAGHIAAIEATTREAPENIGNGLKTIYSRIADVKLGETLEDGVDLGSFAKAIEKVGVEVLDQAGNLRDAGDIIEDLMVAWQDLDQTQRAAVAKTVAGRFQLARFEALMNSADIYEKSVGVSREETGTETYDRMQETYAESMEGRLNTLHATIEGIFTKAFDTDDFYGMIDAATALAKTFDDLVQAMGGGGQAVLAFSAIMTKTFANNIGRGISNMVTNAQTKKMGAENQQIAAQQAQAQLAGKGLNIKDSNVMALANNRAAIAQFAPNMNVEQVEKTNQLFEKQITVYQQLSAAQEKYDQSTSAMKTVLVQLGFSAEEADAHMMGLLRTLEAAGPEAQITAETLGAIGLDQFIDKTYQSQTSITKFIEELERVKAGTGSWEKLQEQAALLGVALTEVSEKAGFTGTKLELVTKVLTALGVVVDGDFEDFEGLKNALQETSITVENLEKGMTKLQNTCVADSDALERERASVESLTAAFTQLLSEGRGVAQGLQLQNVVAGFANLASAGMTAIFAVQSLINVFKILDNEDLTIGEKVEQLTMNIAMVAAMGIPAITQTTTAIGSIKAAIIEWAAATLAQEAAQASATATMAAAAATEEGLTIAKIEEIAAETGLSAETLTAIAVKEGYIAATVAETVAEEGKQIVLEKSVGTLLKAKIAETLLGTTYGKTISKIVLLIASKLGLITTDEALTLAETEVGMAALFAEGAMAPLLLFAAPFIALAGVLIGVGVALHNASEEEKKRKERLQEEIDTNQAAVDSIHEHRDALIQLHAEYQQTGEASDQYKDSLKEQAEALGITNAELLIATGQYELLKAKIDEATLATLGYNDALLQQQQKDNKTAVSGQIAGMSGEAKEAAGLTGDWFTYTGGSSYVYDEDPLTQINKINTAYDENKQKISDLTLELKGLQNTNKDGANDERIQEIYDEIEALEKLQDEYTELLSSDESQSILANQEQLIQNEVLEGQMNGSLGEDMSYDALYEKLKDPDLFPELNAYLAGIGEEDAEAYINGLIGGIAESLNSESLRNQVGLKEAESGFISNLSESHDLSRKDAIAQYDTLTKVDGFNELDDKTKIKVIAGLDTEQSYEEIRADLEETLKRLKEDGTVEGISSADDIVTMSPIDEDVDEKAFQNLGEYIGNNAKDLDGFAVSLGHDTDELANVTEAILRFDSALEASGEKMDEWEEALNSDAIEDKAEAAAELSNVYEDMLDIGDDLSLSDNFVEDADNLELLKQAAEGSEEAYEELQDAAAEDLLIQAGLDTSQVDSAMEDINSLQDQIKDLDIGATIEDEAVYQQLEDIINQAGYSADEASAFLSNIGIDIDPSAFEQGVGELPSVAAEAANMAADAMNIDTEIESGTAEEETTDTYSDVQANITNESFTSTLPAGTVGGAAEVLKGSVASVKYDVQTKPITKQQAVGGFGVKAKTKNGGGGNGGNLHIKRGSAKKGASGGAKYANSSHGGGVKHGGGSGGGGSCFIAGTLVTTQESYKNIEDIVPGDIVLSYNEILQINQYSTVLQTMIHTVNEKLYTLYIEDEQLVVTGIHRFFVKRNNSIEWIEASNLQLNDLVLFADYTWHKIKNIKIKIVATTVYNFEVSNNHNYYVGRNKILAHNKGGGGGSGKSYEPKTKKFEEKEKDRYEKVNTAIDKIDSALQNITMDQDRLSGSRWIDNLEKETGLLKEQVPWYEKKLEIQKEEAAELQKTLSKDFGIRFDENGQLSNYEEIFEKLETERQQAYDKYNAEKTEEGQKKAQDAIDEIEKRQATFEKLYSRYDTLWSKDIPATDKALKEIQDRLEDIAEEARKARREAAETLHDIRDTMRDTEKTYKNLFGEHPKINIDIAMRGIDDIMNGTELNAKAQQWVDDYTDKAKSATGEMKAWYEKQAQGIQQALDNGGLSLFSLNDQNTDDVLRMWDEWNKTGKYTIEGQVSENGEALQEMLKDVVEKGNQMMSDLSNYISDLLDGMEALAEIMDSEIENQLNGLDAINDKIEYQQSMMEIIYGDQASAARVQLLNRQAQAEESRLTVLQKQLEVQQKATQTAKEMYEIDLEKNNGAINQDLLDKYLDAVQKERDIDQEILDTRVAIAEAYRDAKEAANDLAVDNWLKNFDGQINGVNVPLEYMADQWERIQENEELYLDDLNKAYEIQKLSNKYQQMLNNTVDPTIQQQITDQMREQLAYLNEKTNLSKYDVEYANAQLEILQKTIALEDARAAKNQMKLRRDSQGNYQYVYAADQDQTAEAENDLLDATMNAYNMSKEQQASVQDSYIKKVQDMADALRKAANDATLNEEQIAAITQDIIDKGHEYLEAMGEQLNTSQKNMVNSFIDAAEQMQEEYAGKVQSIAEELKENTDRGLDDVDDRFNTSVKNWADGEADIRDESLKTKKIILDNIRSFTAAVGEANVNITEPLGKMQTGMDNIDTSIKKTKDDMEALFTLLHDQSGEFSAAAAQVEVLQKKLSDSNNELSKYYDKLKQAEDKITSQQAEILGYQKQLEAKNGGSNGNNSNNGSNGNGSNGNGSGGNGTINTGDIVTIKSGAKYYEASDNTGGAKTPYFGTGPDKKYKIVKINDASWAKSPYLVGYYSGGKTYGGGWISKDKLEGYDTGGYTGSWNGGLDNKEGRLAFLHQKELVLNAEDTKNVLAAVEAVRVITDQLRSSAFTGSISNAIGRAAQNNIQGNNVEQRVEITANFPNVSSAGEIEKALLNISDRSYQYAYNKNDIPW